MIGVEVRRDLPRFRHRAKTSIIDNWACICSKMNPCCCRRNSVVFLPIERTFLRRSRPHFFLKKVKTKKFVTLPYHSAGLKIRKGYTGLIFLLRHEFLHFLQDLADFFAVFGYAAYFFGVEIRRDGFAQKDLTDDVTKIRCSWTVQII